MTFREALAHWSGVLVCTGGPKCRMAWNGHWSPDVHRKGRVDSMGYIHFSRIDERTNARGLYQFLLLVAAATTDMYRSYHWQNIYYTHRWASLALLRKFGRRAKVEWSAKDRERSWLLNQKVRMPRAIPWPAYRAWVADGLNYLAKQGRRTYLRRPVTKEEEDQMVAARYNGATYAEIAKQTGRSRKVVWTHLRARGMTE